MKKTNSLKTKSHRIQQLLLRAAFFVAIICFFQLQLSLAQVPGMFNYQAVARDASGSVMANQTISIRISVLDGGPTGTASYVETHSITTNQFGLFTIPIGAGAISVGSLTGVNWVGGSEWLKVEMDPAGGASYMDMSTTQLLSVPYAIVAGKANNMNLDDLADVDCSTAQVGQVLKFNGTDWVPGNDNSGSGSSGGGNYIAGSGISISSNNVITNTGDINPYDDITNTTIAGGDLNGTYPNPQVDGLQGKPVSATVPTAGQVLKFDGVQWAPGTDNAGTGSGSSYTAGTGITISGDVISATPATLGGDVTGTSLSNTVTKIQNVSVLNTSPASGQVLKFNGTAWAPGADNGGSGSSYSAGTGISISGSNVISTANMAGDVTGTLNSNVVTKIQTYNVSTNAPGVGDVMKWNGTAWAPGTDNTSGSSGSSLWSQSGANIYNFNGGNVGIGNSTPTALFDAGGSSSLTSVVGKFTNANAANTSNVLNISNNGTGYNLYSYKNGQGEADYFIKDNPNSGTANVYATNNGSGNTVDAFATGTGYAGGFHGGASAQGGIYANVTGSGYAGYFDGAISGGGIYANATGAGNAATLNGKVKIQYTCTNTTTPHLLIYENSATNYARINFQNGSGNNYWSTSGMPNATAANALFGISYNTTGNVMTFTGDGKVGVGINAPTARFHLYGDANFTGSLAQFEINDASNTNDLFTINSYGSGELMKGSKSSYGYGIDIQKTGNMSSTAAIYGGTGGQGGEAIHGDAFGAGGTGVSGNAAGKAGAGSTNFGVYGYAANASANYGVYGQQSLVPSDWAGYFNGNLGYTGTLIGPSDIKLKTDVQPFSGALNSVMNLKPMTYKFRHDGDYQYMRLPEADQIGLIAQDLEQVFPNLVNPTTFTYQERAKNENGKEAEGTVTTKQIDYKGVNYIGLIPVLVGAIQEQQKEIEDLKLQLSRLQK